MKSGEGAIGLGQIFTMTVGTIIGIGWITMLGIWLQQAGSAGAMIAFVGGTFLILPIVFCYAELAAAIPRPGGEIAYLQEVGGQAAGLAAGWLLLLTFLSVIAFEAVSTGWVLAAMIPALGSIPPVSIAGLQLRLPDIVIGIAGMILIATINLRGSGAFARLQDGATYGKLGVSALFVAAGLLWGETENLSPLFAGASERAHVDGVLAILVTTPFWFAGFNAATQAIGARGQQIRLRGIGTALVGAVLVSLLFYCLVIAAASMAAPRADILRHQLAAAGAFESLFGVGFARVVLLAGLLGLVSTWNAVFFAASRVLMSMAEQGVLPRRLARGGSATSLAPMAACTAACVGAVGVLLGRGIIGPVVNASGSCITALFVLVCAAVLRLRRTRPDLLRPYRVPGGGATIWAALLISVGLFGLSLYQPFVEAGSVPVEWWILGAWFVAGGVVIARMRKGGAA